MTIEEIKAAKQQCESEVRAIIYMFEMQSGCSIYGINLIHVETVGKPMRVAVVNLDVRINE